MPIFEYAPNDSGDNGPVTASYEKSARWLRHLGRTAGPLASLIRRPIDSTLGPSQNLGMLTRSGISLCALRWLWC